MGAGRVETTFSEFVSLSAIASLGWFIAVFLLTFALAYAFPPPTNRIEFPGAAKVVWLVVGLLFLATAALVWMKDSS